jgi:hypothetical protein
LERLDAKDGILEKLRDMILLLKDLLDAMRVESLSLEKHIQGCLALGVSHHIKQTET